VVRHPLVSRIVHAYGEAESQRKSGARYGAHYDNAKDADNGAGADDET
jgi:hypothetical protein